MAACGYTTAYRAPPSVVTFPEMAAACRDDPECAAPDACPSALVRAAVQRVAMASRRVRLRAGRTSVLAQIVVAAWAGPDADRLRANQASCPARVHGCRSAMGHDFLSATAELLRQAEQTLRDAQERRQDASQKVARQRERWLRAASHRVGGQSEQQGARREELAPLAQPGESVLVQSASPLLAQR